MKNTLMTIVYVVLTFIFMFTLLNIYFLRDDPKPATTAEKSLPTVKQ